MPKAGSEDEAILVLAPFGRDAELAGAMLADAGIQCRHGLTIDGLSGGLIERCGALLVTEEVLTEPAIPLLSRLLETQPVWSNLPVVLCLSRVGQRPVPNRESLVAALGQGRGHGVILLERPIRVASFISIMRSAVLARRRQYELRDQLVARQRAETHALMLTTEMKHRIKNSLAMVGAIAFQTFRNAESVNGGLAAFSARLKSMALAQDLLTQDGHDGADLHDMASQALKPYQANDADRIAIAGPPVWIAGRMATPLMMALHELATNAVKYGALSVASGQVAIRWHVEEAASTRTLHLEWREHSGPVVAAPKQRGFGSRLVERALALELGGHAKIAFEPSGVVCEIRTPLGGAN